MYSYFILPPTEIIKYNDVKVNIKSKNEKYKKQVCYLPESYKLLFGFFNFIAKTKVLHNGTNSTVEEIAVHIHCVSINGNEE